MTTKPAGNEEQLAAQAETEASEIRADIEETRQEAAEAREDGDTATAAKLEKRLDGLETDLKSVLGQLQKLVERPFHPAPEERTDTSSDAAPDGQGRTGDGAAEKDAAPETPAKPRGRRPSRRFFGTRADYDD